MIVDPFQQLSLAGLRVRTFQNPEEAAETLSGEYRTQNEKGGAALIAMDAGPDGAKLSVRELVKMQMATDEGQKLLLVRGLAKLRALCVLPFPCHDHD